MVILDFSKPENVHAFHRIDDRVMGGISASSLLPGDGCAVFEGEVSFEHHGGFASVRSAPGSWDLSGFSGIEIEVKGDGKSYKFSITTDPRYESVVYRGRFVAPEEGWTSLRIPFTEFIPTFRGEIVPEAGPLDPASIDSFGFLISDRQEGRFSLNVRSVQAF